MPAFVVVEIDVRDEQAYEQYKELAAASVGRYDGRYVARGGATETLEGGWSPRRLVLLEFPSAERAREWFNSSEYGEARAVRASCADVQMVLTEGLTEGLPGSGGPTIQI